MAQREIGYLLYNLILIIFAVLLLPYFVCRNLILRRPLLPYFKNLSRQNLERLDGKPVIWIQAVSVGETVVANCILGEIRKLLPDYQIVFTTTTPTGQAMAKKLLDETTIITYFPFDFPWLVKRFIRLTKPRLFIMVETEIWPNAIRYAHDLGTKVAIINGRISDRSFKRYLKGRRFLKGVLSRIDLLAMQSADDANRIGELGADLHRIMVTGNAKFDQDYPEFSNEELQQFRDQYGWDGSDRVFTAASTHHGEDEVIIAAYLQLLQTQAYNLILAPRHPERGGEIERLLTAAGLPFCKRSAGGSGNGVKVILLDTFGELGMAYAQAEVVFVGGSLVKTGGHNVLEAAVQAKPVLYGPYMHNFRESKRLLEEVDAGFAVHNSAEMVAKIQELTMNTYTYRHRASSARKAVLANKGAAQSAARLVADLVGQSS